MSETYIYINKTQLHVILLVSVSNMKKNIYINNVILTKTKLLKFKTQKLLTNDSSFKQTTQNYHLTQHKHQPCAYINILYKNTFSSTL